jgi:hypothetical protein
MRNFSASSVGVFSALCGQRLDLLPAQEALDRRDREETFQGRRAGKPLLEIDGIVETETIPSKTVVSSECVDFSLVAALESAGRQ